MKTKDVRKQIEFGDWQTPLFLTNKIIELLDKKGICPKTIIEPTCGKGNFLISCRKVWPDAKLIGFEINNEYIEHAKSILQNHAEIHHADFFTVQWENVFKKTQAPVLIIGNPPWVTNAKLGTFLSKNLPNKQNIKNFSGFDAITGKSNFDISEWMILRLLYALRKTVFTFSVLCKLIVAQRVMEAISRKGWVFTGTLHDIDAKLHFKASVNAVLMTITQTSQPMFYWDRFSSLSALKPFTKIGCIENKCVSNINAYKETQYLVGNCSPQWRSGVKHDCVAIMEFNVRSGKTFRKTNEELDLESSHLFPMMKGSDVANKRWPPTRQMLVPQKQLFENTNILQQNAPKTWSYLQKHRGSFLKRKSSIYKNKPVFSVFGIGEYTFMPWKIAIAGLYKKLVFMRIPSFENKPVVFDDTVYFIGFQSKKEAQKALIALTSPLATRFFQSRIFWENKRPINKKILQSLDLRRLQQILGQKLHFQTPNQMSLALF